MEPRSPRSSRSDNDERKSSPRSPRTSSAPPRRPRHHTTTSCGPAGLALVRSQSTPTVRERVRMLFRASAAAQMHSVGVLGKNEHLEPSGSLRALTAVEEEEEEEEEEDNIFQQVVDGGSLSAAVFGIIKGTVGPAILYLPRGFRQSGYLVAIPSMVFATAMYIYNAYRLLECWKVESQRNQEMVEHMHETVSYLNMKNGDNHKEVVPEYTPVLLTYGELARRALGRYSFFVKLGICLFQFGVVVSYCIFVPHNLQECFETLTGHSISKVYFLALMILIEIPLAWIVDIRKLTPCNVVATGLIAFGLVAVLSLALHSGLSMSDDNDEVSGFVHNLQTFPAFTEVWFLFVGTSFFMMEGSITLIVPLQEAVAHPKDRAAFPSTNAKVTASIVLFYIFFSLFCGAGFGENIQTALTASLEGTLATAVQLAYSIAVILTFPLQNFPALQVACSALLGRRFRPDTSSVERSLVASVIILVLGLIAVVAIDYLGNVVSILGSLFGIPLALVFPPLMHNSLVKDSSRMTRVTNYCVVAVGVFAMGAASYATIENWHNNTEE